MILYYKLIYGADVKIDKTRFLLLAKHAHSKWRGFGQFCVVTSILIVNRLDKINPNYEMIIWKWYEEWNF